MSKWIFVTLFYSLVSLGKAGPLHVPMEDILKSVVTDTRRQPECVYSFLEQGYTPCYAECKCMPPGPDQNNCDKKCKSRTECEVALFEIAGLMKEIRQNGTSQDIPKMTKEGTEEIIKCFRTIACLYKDKEAPVDKVADEEVNYVMDHFRDVASENFSTIFSLPEEQDLEKILNHPNGCDLEY